MHSQGHNANQNAAKERQKNIPKPYIFQKCRNAHLMSHMIWYSYAFILNVFEVSEKMKLFILPNAVTIFFSLVLNEFILCDKITKVAKMNYDAVGAQFVHFCSSFIFHSFIHSFLKEKIGKKNPKKNGVAADRREAWDYSISIETICHNLGNENDFN